MALLGIVFGANSYYCVLCCLLLYRTCGGNRMAFIGLESSGTAPTFNASIELLAHNDGHLGLKCPSLLLLALNASI